MRIYKPTDKFAESVTKLAEFITKPVEKPLALKPVKKPPTLKPVKKPLIPKPVEKPPTPKLIKKPIEKFGDKSFDILFYRLLFYLSYSINSIKKIIYKNIKIKFTRCERIFRGFKDYNGL